GSEFLRPPARATSPAVEAEPCSRRIVPPPKRKVRSSSCGTDAPPLRLCRPGRVAGKVGSRVLPPRPASHKSVCAFRRPGCARTRPPPSAGRLRFVLPLGFRVAAFRTHSQESVYRSQLVWQACPSTEIGAGKPRTPRP